MTRRRLAALSFAALTAAALGACRRPAAIPSDLFAAEAAGGWHRTSLRDVPASEAPDPVPRSSIDRIVAASYEGPGKIEARVYALSAREVALDLVQRWRPSADTVFFQHGPFFVVLKWQSADRQLLKQFIADLEKRLASTDSGK